MSVVKLTKSGNAVLFIDDFGNSFITSKVFLQNLLSGKNKSPFMLLKRLPDPVSVDRFMKSPVLEFKSDGSVVEHEAEKIVRTRPVGDVRNVNDALSVRTANDKQASVVYNSDFVLEE